MTRKTVSNIVVLIALLFGAYPLMAQTKVLQLNDDISGQFIGDYYRYHKDKDYQYTIQEVSHDSFVNKLEDCDLKRSNFGNDELTIWNKLVVSNNTDHKWYLDVGVYTIDSLTFYKDLGNGNFQVIKEGRARPFKDKLFKSNSYLFELDIPKGDTATYYLQVSAFIMQFPTKVYTAKDYINMAHKKDLTTGVFLGIMMLVFFYNFFIWIATQDKNYFYYSVYVLCGAIFIFELNGLASEILFRGIMQEANIHGPFIVAVASIASIVFSVKFLETKKRAPILDKILRYVMLPGLVLVIGFDLLNWQLAGSVTNQLIGLTAIFLLSFAAIKSYTSGLNSAKYYLLGRIFYFTGVAIFILKTFAILPYTDYFNRAIETGLSLEMVFFSFALAGKINQYKKEKTEAVEHNKKLVEEQNIVLERTVEERTRDLSLEKEKSEALLLNILPTEIADELKSTGEVEAKIYESVSILFSDFKNFTKISSNYTADQLITELNIYFKAFDKIVTDHGVEKIKTIGDAYMAAAGFTKEKKDSLKQTVLAALSMQEFVNHRHETLKSQGESSFRMRVGIHNGPVVAGVVGEKKFQYDIWGDAVNTAARMETSGEIDKVNVSEDVFQLLKDETDLHFEERGEMAVKGKGSMRMFFVERANLSLNEK